VQTTPPFAPLYIISSSKYIIDCFTKKLTSWEECGWIKIPNREIIKAIVSHLRARGAITTFSRATEPIGLENANLLVNEGSHKISHDILDLKSAQKFNLSRAQLSAMSQGVAYLGIQDKTQHTQRLPTIINLDITRHAVKRVTCHLPTDTTIWHSLRSKDVTRTIRVFLWKVMHKAHKCGDYWLKIPEFEHCSNCPECGVEDSMAHILTECNILGQIEVWDLTTEIWLKKHNYWPQVDNLGGIMGCGLIKFLSKTGWHKLGAEQLYWILMTESAHLIWRIRCEHILEYPRDKWHTTKEIQNRWHCAINKRLTLDQAMTNKRYKTKAISAKTVLCTWSGTLQSELSLSENWINCSGVLVGIKPPEQPWWQPAEPP
jgi:ribonuclease HI